MLQAVKGNMVRECKCHGVSGSCTMRTCWKALPQFRQIGDHLMRKYWRARAVSLIEGTGLQTKRGKTRPRRSDLVYLEPSPNYCEQDLNAGSLGTVGRFCNRSSTGNISKINLKLSLASSGISLWLCVWFRTVWTKFICEGRNPYLWSKQAHTYSSWKFCRKHS